MIRMNIIQISDEFLFGKVHYSWRSSNRKDKIQLFIFLLIFSWWPEVFPLFSSRVSSVFPPFPTSHIYDLAAGARLSLAIILYCVSCPPRNLGPRLPFLLGIPAWSPLVPVLGSLTLASSGPAHASPGRSLERSRVTPGLRSGQGNMTGPVMITFPLTRIFWHFTETRCWPIFGKLGIVTRTVLCWVKCSS